MTGRSIRIFLPDGSPAGLRVADLGLSTIRCVVAPRAMLADLAGREEARRTGLYFITGPDPDQPTRTNVYVGEGDDVLTRLKEHNKDEDKDFWETAYVIVSKDEMLTKAHVRWLEARSIGLLKQAKRSIVVNTAAPNGGALPEADSAEMSEFLEQVRILLPALGFSGFEPEQHSMVRDRRDSEVEFRIAGDGYSAVGQRAEGNFLVRSGARVRPKESKTFPKSSRAVREALRDSGALVERGGLLELTQDYAFNSPSQAAEVVCGFSINGRTAWTTSAGMSLGQWEDQMLDRADSGDAAPPSKAEISDPSPGRDVHFAT